MTYQSESLFWDNYISKTKAYRIKSATARWCVRHTESYIKADANFRLAQHSAAQKEKYLGEKAETLRLSCKKITFGFISGRLPQGFSQRFRYNHRMLPVD